MITRKSELGVSMLEFGIASLVLIPTILFSIEVFLALYRYQMLVDAVTRASRIYAINFPTTDLNTTLTTQVRNYISSTYGMNSSSIVVSGNQSTLSGNCSLQVSASWPNTCIYCFYGGFTPQAFSESIIEDECQC